MAAAAAGAAIFRLLPILIPIEAAEVRAPAFQAVRFTDREGNLLQEVLSRDGSRALRVPLERISPYLVRAAIAAEDKRFFRHGGVDCLAVARAAMQNLAAGRIVSGGSTITLQLTRMLHPSPRTLPAKFREAFTAWRLEAGMSKEDILEEYLNRIPLGGNIYGAEAGARAIFGVSAADLSLAQASFLAALPNSPTRLNPFRDLAAARDRQRYVLERMAATKAIGPERVPLATREKISLREQEASFLAPHFVFHLLEGLPHGVRSVETTIDSALQMTLTRQVRDTVRSLRDRRVTNAAAILLDNDLGEIVAYVGSADFFDSTHGGQNNGVEALRQPGSTLKPFLYGLAFERGLTGASLLADIPSAFAMPAGVFRPRNYSETFQGPVRARVALANSLNVPAVRLTARVGVHRLLEKLRSFGFESLDRSADHYGAGLALGDGEVRLSQLAAAYLTLATGGEPVPARSIRRVDGKPIEDAAALPPAASVLEERASYLVTDILSDRFARSAAFGTRSVLALPFPCAVKTGTSFQFADNWAVGFTSRHTLAVWVGNFDGRPMQRVSGVSGAGPLFRRIMLSLYEGGRDPPAFHRPPGLSEVEVCSLSGKRPGPHCASTVAEVIPEERVEGFKSDICRMHAAEGIIYPPEFRRWAAEAGVPRAPEAAPPATAAEGAFAIFRPADGTIFRRLPDLAPEFQSVRFELLRTVGSGRVQWLLDGAPVAVTEPPHSLLWKVEEGVHSLAAVELPDGRRSRTVHFTVH